MKTIIENQNMQHHNSRTTVGAVILVIGSILLINQLNLSFIPDWLFSWPMILIAIGVYSGVKHNFRNKTWFIFMLLGIAFLLENSGLFISNVIWPVALIAFGVYIIVRRSYNDKQPEKMAE
jgi:predicted membrane protein